METSLTMIAGTGALILAFSVIVAKFLFTQRLAGINRQINQLSRVKHDALNRLKMAQSQKAVAQKNKSGLKLKKVKLAKKLSHLEQELTEAREEENVRHRRARARTVS